MGGSGPREDVLGSAGVSDELAEQLRLAAAMIGATLLAPAATAITVESFSTSQDQLPWQPLAAGEQDRLAARLKKREQTLTNRLDQLRRRHVDELRRF